MSASPYLNGQPVGKSAHEAAVEIIRRRQSKTDYQREVERKRDAKVKKNGNHN